MAKGNVLVSQNILCISFLWVLSVLSLRANKAEYDNSRFKICGRTLTIK